MKKYFKPLDWKILIPITGIIFWILIFTIFTEKFHLFPKWLEIIFFISSITGLFNYIKWEKICK
jgi:hypothetical protein